ncbi:O-antigen ligase family protein [Jannaschia ovalis]|uniref:O-antigen ligase family protein n=1 Tax=Jannaschia ovalis TaxID=3038773 RepID=A0ABY8LC75_9RHOB|nr:O-antigen ligase family protein [Jannaschia sp. GRR-S6-38]WGH78927.1 O-antigen ligase family protein [Jannaschia sp. GRR-S6-38]
MTVAAAGIPAPGATERAFWALADVTLLCLVLAAASDMLIQLGPIQSLAWMTCYGLALLRIGMTWPAMVPLAMRSGAVMAYPAVCLASTLWSGAPAGTLVSALQLAMTVVIAAYLGWRYSITVLLKGVAVLLTAGSALSLLHWATGVFPWPIYTEAGGLSGLYAHKNMLGQRALFCLAALAAVLLMRRAEAGLVFKALALGALGVNLLALALSKSATSVLLLPVMIGLVLLLCARRVPSVLGIAMVAVAVLGLALTPLGLALMGIHPVEAVLSAVGKSSTLTGRTLLWDIAMDVHRDHPVLGTGYRAFWMAPEFANGRVLTYEAGARDAASFHNFALEILVSVGWPGLVAMLATILLAGQRLLRLFLRDGQPAVAGALAILVGIVVASLVGASLFRPHEIMIVLLVAFAVSAGEDLRRMPVAPAPAGRARLGRA